MSANSKIQWTEATWNPVRGCSRISEGCRNCYAERQAARFSGNGEPFDDLCQRHTEIPVVTEAGTQLPLDASGCFESLGLSAHAEQHLGSDRLKGLKATADSAEGKRMSCPSPCGWRYRVLVDKHSTGTPLPGEMVMLDISRQEVWGKPGMWRYSDGPNKPDVDWMCEAEPLYTAIPFSGATADSSVLEHSEIRSES